MKPDMKKTCTVIGGGTSGLMAGALLSVSGFEVTVLEKNPSLGGGMQMFTRSGTTFETGMHVIAGHHGGLVGKLLDFLGIRDEIEIIDTDPDVADSVYVASEGRSYRIPYGKEAFIKYLSGEFPHEAANIRAYTEELFHIYGSFPLIGASVPDERAVLGGTADEFIANYVKDERLRSLLGWLNMMSGTVAGRTPVYVHAVINALYISGAGRLAGGPAALVKALCRIIRVNGGRVLNGEKVTGINVKDGFVASVSTEKGGTWQSDSYLWACGVKELAALAGKSCFSRFFIGRLAAAEDSFSAFSVFIKLKKETLEYVNHSLWWHSDMEAMWRGGNSSEESWPSSILYMTPPSAGQGRWADRLIALVPMDFGLAGGWAGTCRRDRPVEYLSWKTDMTEKVLDCLEAVLPGIRGMAEDISSASPLTVRDWYGNSSGGIYGLSREVANVFGNGISPRTKLGNLFLAGQDLKLHGLCGAWASALIAAAGIIGNDEIINDVLYERY